MEHQVVTDELFLASGGTQVSQAIPNNEQVSAIRVDSWIEFRGVTTVGDFSTDVQGSSDLDTWTTISSITAGASTLAPGKAFAARERRDGQVSLLGMALVLATVGCSNTTNVTLEFEDDGGITVEMDSTFSPPPTCPTTTTWASNNELEEAPGVDEVLVYFGNGVVKVSLSSLISNTTPYTTNLVVSWNDGAIACGEEFPNVTVNSDPGRTYCTRINDVAYAISFTIDITSMTASKLWFDVKVCQDEEANCDAPDCEE